MILGFRATSHSFSCRTIIFGLRELCTIEKWGPLTFFENSVFLRFKLSVTVFHLGMWYLGWENLVSYKIGHFGIVFKIPIFTIKWAIFPIFWQFFNINLVILKIILKQFKIVICVINNNGTSITPSCSGPILAQRSHTMHISRITNVILKNCQKIGKITHLTVKK